MARDKDSKDKDKTKGRDFEKEKKSSNDLDGMIAYVDAYGNITDTPPDPEEQDEIELDDIRVSVPSDEQLAEEGLLEEEVNEGIITFFNDEKGFGFIKNSQSGQDVFVHINNAYENIRENHKVSYDVEMTPKGPSAVNVKQIK